ncbi:MAG TPA: FG-GAP repeat protein [Candidatus Wunengus sp. YC64]|uniref:FG-GAP repeat protein n=1 Tax=Candidatus Wunengus sp. YC64 TaxID=3367700 RepID=UPI00402A5DAF
MKNKNCKIVTFIHLSIVVLVLGCSNTRDISKDYRGLSAPVVTSKPVVHNGKVKNLHPVLNSRISNDIGRDNSRYYAIKVDNGYMFKDEARGVSALVTAEGMTVIRNDLQWGISLEKIGDLEIAGNYGVIKPKENRIEVEKGVVTEWYVNGPGGLQQGWVVKERPQSGDGLVLCMKSGGALKAKEEDRGTLGLYDDNKNRVLGYSGLYAYDANGKEVGSRFEVHGGNILVKLDGSDARYPVTIDPWVETAKLTASDLAEFNLLGSSVSISGDGGTVVAADTHTSSGTGNNRSAVYVYSKPSGGWTNSTEVAKLTPTQLGSGESFGPYVSMSADGSTVAVASSSGNVYVFSKPSGGWADSTETAKLTASTGQYGSTSGFGKSVSISSDGGTVVTYADSTYMDITDDGENNPEQIKGVVFVFERSGSGWANSTETVKLTFLDGRFDYGNLIRSPVSISADGGTVVTAGYADEMYVFSRPGIGWENVLKAAKLTASDTASSGDLGLGGSLAVSSDGSTVAAGAYEKSDSGYNRGAVYLFSSPIGGWSDRTETAILTASDAADNDQLGFSVAISSDGSTVAAGAPYKVSAGSNRGAVYVYSKPVGGWADGTETAQLTASDVSDLHLGNSVAINSDGSTVVAGAPGEGRGNVAPRGSVYVYDTGTPKGGYYEVEYQANTKVYQVLLIEDSTSEVLAGFDTEGRCEGTIQDYYTGGPSDQEFWLRIEENTTGDTLKILSKFANQPIVRVVSCDTKKKKQEGRAGLPRPWSGNESEESGGPPDEWVDGGGTLGSEITNPYEQCDLEFAGFIKLRVNDKNGNRRSMKKEVLTPLKNSGLWAEDAVQLDRFKRVDDGYVAVISIQTTYCAQKVQDSVTLKYDKTSLSERSLVLIDND